MKAHLGVSAGVGLSLSGCFALFLTVVGILSPVAAQTAGERETAIRAAGQLRVCIWPAYFAITYRNPRTGDLEGIDIELAREFAADLGVKPVFVETTFVGFMDELEHGRCDVAMFGVGVTQQRQAKVDFSRPYLRSDVYAVTTKAQTRINSWTDIDRAGVVVAVQAGTFMEPLMRAALKNAELMVVAQPKTREAEIESGRADVFMSDYPYTRLMILTYDWARIIEPREPVSPTDYAYAVRKGDPEWLARIDRFVSAIKSDGRLARAAAAFGLSPIVVK